ncbi:gp436 family protein [Methylophaga thiooxydans]|uniref:gp436 family protein n=1 Tax=Methylophaga thiooxydans TaxID=392484 RepID=UPI0023554A16|nr:phage protein Gp36 family protein [Methylophaga thiooxydans]
MPYCTQQDLVTRYGEDELIQLTDKQNTGQLDTDVINLAIADSDSMIDGYLGGRYSLPIEPLPRSLVRIACEITRYYLYENLAPDEVKDRYNEAVKSLKSIARGELSIGISTEGAKPLSQNTVKINTGGNVFNRKDKSFI